MLDSGPQPASFGCKCIRGLELFPIEDHRNDGGTIIVIIFRSICHVQMPILRLLVLVCTANVIVSCKLIIYQAF
jgi:hypothetical protein